MKGLHNFLQTKVKPKFEPKEGKRKSLAYWSYDSLETFLFTPGHATIKGSHVRDSIDLKRTMMMVILALLPCLLFGIFNIGHQHLLATGEITYNDSWSTLLGDKISFGLSRMLPLLIVSYGVGLGIEFIFCTVKGHEIHEGFLVSGMLIPLIMPMDVPLWMVAVGTAFAVVIGKEVFGGTGMNILNIALTARAFMFFAYPNQMSGNKIWITGKENGSYVDGVSGATPMGDLASFSQEVPNLTNDMASLAGPGSMEIAKMKTEMPSQFLDLGEQAFTAKYSLFDSFIGIIPGCTGETSALACLIGAVLLLLTGIASWRIMLSFFIGGLGMAYLLNLNAGDADVFMSIDPIHQLMLGGFMFGMVFMITDPVTASQTNTGKWIYGALAGSFAILIRILNPAYPEGVFLAILFANVCAPLIDHMVISQNIKRRTKRLKTA